MDIHGIDNSCFFYYDNKALNIPLSDRGGSGVSIYVNSIWQAVIVIPYGRNTVYVDSKYNGQWTGWSSPNNS